MRVKEVIRDSGIPVADIAREVGVSTQAVYAWRKGESLPKHEHITALCKALGIGPGELYATD